MLGFSNPSELLGRNPLDFIIPEDRERVRSISLRRVHGEPAPHLYEFRIQRKDGAIVPIEVHGTTIEYDGKIGTLGFRRDISERKRLEEKLRESEEKYRVIVERNWDAVVTFDAKGRITYASPAIHLMTGHLPAEVEGKTFDNFLQKEDAQRNIQYVQAVLRGEAFESQEMKIVRNDGSICYAEINSSPIFDESGLVTGAQAIIRDVSERHKYAELKDIFTSSVTHELRTPLVSIKGYLDLILKNERFQKETASYLEVVKRNVDRLMNLTNDLLDFQRLQVGKLQVSLTRIDYITVIDSCIKEMMPMINGRRQTLEVNIPKSIHILGDPVRLTQVVMNVLDNASKFTPDGGRIIVRVEDEADRVTTQISDSGIGIRKDDLKQVFEPFSTIKKSTYIKGTGLGLSVTKGLVEVHGGKIWVESPGEGKGTRVSFTIARSIEVT
jgi:PAS domain S-box-containing protein